MNWLVVFIGGGIGSVARYAVSLALNGRGFPFGTFAVNVAGCFLIGLFGALSSRLGWSETTRLLLSVGLCGGFTTFSTFSNECLAMARQGEMLPLAIYAVLSIVCGIAAVFIGWWIAK